MKNEKETSKKVGAFIGILSIAVLVMGGFAPTAVAEEGGGGQTGPSCVSVGTSGETPWIQVDPQCDPIPDLPIPPP